MKSNQNSAATRIVIESLAPGGDGIGHLDGKACFVPFSAPGDLLDIRVTENKRRFCRAEIVDIAVPGPGRRKPPCDLFGFCGGCDWLHLEEAAQVDAKRRFLEHALGLERCDFSPSPDALGYRRVARMRIEPRPGARPALGFLRERAREVVDVESCPVLDRSLGESLKPLKEKLLGHVSERAQLRLLAGDSGRFAIVETGKPLPPAFYQAAAGLAPGFFGGILASVDGVLASVAGEERVVVRGFDDKPLTMPAASFGQANAGANRLLCRTVADWVAEAGYFRIIELFSGAGNLTVGLARNARKLTAIELDGNACSAARQNLSERGFGHAAVRQGDALEAYRNAGDPHDLVVLDPPRSGHLELARAIADGNQRAVLYVSCSPQTLGRDMQALARGGYRLSRAAGFDMFPQTAHLEAAVLFER